jgi:hypothetical protein
MGARYVWINVLVGRLFAVAVDAEQRLISVSTSLTPAASSATSCGLTCGNRCNTLDGTASIESRTVHNPFCLDLRSIDQRSAQLGRLDLRNSLCRRPPTRVLPSLMQWPFRRRVRSPVREGVCSSSGHSSPSSRLEFVMCSRRRATVSLRSVNLSDRTASAFPDGPWAISA